ncbi:MAG: energy transducer TonB [Terriglobia bacterium]|nr:energy transducer TonB [Terriglobia bacterium]
MHKRSIGSVAIALLLPLTVLAQEHASARVVQYHDSPAGRTTSLVTPVRLVYFPDPEYTKAARFFKVKGTLILEGTLGTDGCVRKLRVMSGLGYGLDENALHAVQRWKFEPFQKDGVPAIVKIRIGVNFDPLWSPDKAALPEKPCGAK